MGPVWSGWLPGIAWLEGAGGEVGWMGGIRRIG